ncbi:MAG: HAMP domain-containing sensor histidine kinase [Chitinophagaceae bacterium]
MFIGIKTKILLTVLAVVLLFTIFSLYYFPTQQGRTLLMNYRNEVRNQARTIALGASIALSEQNFRGIKTAMDYVREDQELRFVALIQSDTVWNSSRTAFSLKDSVVVSYPDDKPFDINLQSNDSLIVTRAPFRSGIMNGDIMLVVSTQAINKRQKKIWLTALGVSAVIFLIGLLIGLWLSRSISHPVLALRKAAKRVGEGDLTSEVKSKSRDEIGELAEAFNNMVRDIRSLTDLTLAQEKEKQHLLAKQNEELEREVSQRTRELQESLEHLKETQTQLVHSEKMASLGELTAGIAHEIQNPLNFVNNFSDLNSELLDELTEALDKGDMEEAREIIRNLSDNEKKIVHHGQRADGIVKGMLQHSRNNSGQKEHTDLNELCDEYLRLAYHGMRARDKSFTAHIETRLDPALGKVNVIPQDIGRVLLNLINNALYAVAEKKKTAGEGYELRVRVSTRRVKDKVEIEVEDNGDGIPPPVRDKIFQPFFTTKPTGEGTGLGLSLSYDIVTKGHGGELKFESETGKGTRFFMILP